MRAAERQYYGDQLELNKQDLGKSWKTIKEIIGKSNRNENNLKFNVNGTMTNDPLTIANAFNNYFVDIGPTLANKITQSANPIDYVKQQKNSIFIPNIEESEVKNIITQLKHSSPGWDELPTSIFKPATEAYISPLTYLINRSIIDGIFPDELKIAKVIPIFKSGDKTMISNYRPISVLSYFKKISEKVMYNHLLNFIEKHNILYKFQFGFRKNHSTSHAIITLVERINNAFHSGKIMIGVFLDLKKSI